MKFIASILFFVLISFSAANAQQGKPEVSFCGKTGDITMTWDEFMACKKEIVTLDKAASVSSFILTIKKAVKKDYVFEEYPAKGNVFTKAGMDALEKLHKENKLGNQIMIDNIEIVQSGKSAKKVASITITLN